jgi:HlyD family secretion protein
MKKAIIILFIISMLVVAAFFLFQGKKEQINYTTEPVTRGEITDYITASGTIIPLKTTIIGSQVSGPIKEIFVDYNTMVQKGQLLALIDPALFEAKVAEGKANVLSAKAAYDKLIAVLKNNERIMNRNKELYETDLIARIEFENAETDYLSTKAELESARAKIDQAEAVLNNALTNLKYTRIVSPTRGIVISKDVEVGQTVAASFQTPTLFTIAEDLTKMQIETNVSEADISKVKVGQNVEFSVDSYPGETFYGKVVQIRNSPETIQNVVTYFVIIDVNNDDLKLMPGMTANVTIITSSKKNILLVPNASLKFTPGGDKSTVKYDQQGIWILENDTPQRVNIETGLSDEQYTEITGGDLQEGQHVIVGTAENTQNNRKGSKRMRFF